ncbi:MAG: hypothetical protein LBB26_03560 [Puniceicoccales bacterium]|nr:hypothetical protein [Puniceicoccales bacterium]
MKTNRPQKADRYLREQTIGNSSADLPSNSAAAMKFPHGYIEGVFSAPMFAGLIVDKYGLP